MTDKDYSSSIPLYHPDNYYQLDEIAYKRKYATNYRIEKRLQKIQESIMTQDANIKKLQDSINEMKKIVSHTNHNL